MNIFFNALLFYSCIRVPQSVEVSEETLSKAYRFLPLVGWIVGGLSAGVLYLTRLFLPKEVAVLCAMAAMMWLTGAMHEDGLADFADGFGGGRDRERILRIMKDSSIGTYGVLVLIVSLMMKYALLTSFPTNELLIALIVGQSASRFMPLLVVYSSSYVQRADAKAGHSRLGIDGWALLVGGMFGLLPLLLMEWQVGTAYLVLALLLFCFFKRYTEKRIGGYTGDTLGALIQLSELLFYTIALAFLS